MKWDKRTVSNDETPVMFTKYLIWFGDKGRLDLHKIISKDFPGFFHSHPANAFRIVLWGWYVEELVDGTKKTWFPGMMGFVPGPLMHRFDKISKPTFTLWLRGRSQFKIRVKQL